MLIAALFYQEFIKQFIEQQEKWTQIIELVNTILTTLPNTKITQIINDPSQHENLVEFQLRWDKELADKEEDKKYQSIKQIIMPTIQSYIQKTMKDQNISNENKQTILNLTKKI
jgi:hypothetical protein